MSHTKDSNKVTLEAYLIQYSPKTEVYNYKTGQKVGKKFCVIVNSLREQLGSILIRNGESTKFCKMYMCIIIQFIVIFQIGQYHLCLCWS